MTMRSSCRQGASITDWFARLSASFGRADPVGAAACAAAAPQDDSATIRAALVTWTQAFNGGRADDACALFPSDLRFDVRGAPERGYGEMCVRLHRAPGDTNRHFSYALRINEVLVSGDVANCAAWSGG
jgi:ketosteroid isomerase-like protein